MLKKQQSTLYSKRLRNLSIKVVLLPLLAIGLIVGILPSQPAAASYSNLDAEGRARSYAYYKAAQHCVAKMEKSIISDSESDGTNTNPLQGFWFGNKAKTDDPSHGNPVHVAPYKDTNKNPGERGCANAINTAINDYWKITPVDFLKGIGYEWKQDGSKGFRWVHNSSGSTRETLLTNLLSGKGISVNNSRSNDYAVNLMAFKTTCSATQHTINDTNKTYAENKQELNNRKYRYVYEIDGNKSKQAIFSYDLKVGWSNMLYQGNGTTCAKIVDVLSDARYINAYIDEVLTDKCRAAGVAVTGIGSDALKTACLHGAKNLDRQDICKGYSDPKHAEACRLGQGVAISENDKPGSLVNQEESTSNPTTCVIEGIGWIICPIVTAGAKATDALYAWISSFLKIPALNMDTASNTNTAYIAWKTVRNVANVAFVIAFLIIIFSQLTGAGVSNYGVKKMLPRLIIASILVNTSYWITAIAVDISNIAGENIYNLLRTIELGDISPQDNIAELVTTVVLGGASTGLALWGGKVVLAAGSAAVGSTGAALLWFIVPVILAAALALFVAFTILALRHALIIILIVVSPLAFVAFLLPNTEKFFDMWRKSLITLLVFYPLFSMLFGGSYVASMIIIGSAGSSDENAATGMLIPLALAIQFIPLFLTPLLIKFSTGVMGTVAGMVNNKNKGLIDRSKRIRDRKAKLAFHETLGSNRATRNPFVQAARSLYRRSQNSTLADAQRKTNYESANKAAFLETERASELNVTGAQTGQLISALESEQNAEALETADTATQLRKRLADDRSKLATLNQDARYAESKVTQGPGGGAGDIERDIRVASSRAASASNIMNQNYASDLQNSEALRREAGGVDPRGAARVAAAAAATISKADDDAMAAAAVPIKEGLETVKANGGDPDDYLRKAITDASARGDTDSLSAALDLTSSLGRTGVIREARANPSIDSVAVQRAISANAGALIGKAPDLVKGTGAAFETVKGNDLVSFSKDTIKSYTNYLEGKLAAGDIQGFNDSYTAFSNAVEDIRKNPTLQAQFGGDIGREIIKSFQNAANLAAYAPSSIDPISGKIR